MKATDLARAQISAIVDDVASLSASLGLPAERGDEEAWLIVHRLERKMRADLLARGIDLPPEGVEHVDTTGDESAR